jgi:hypothetical protein
MPEDSREDWNHSLALCQPGTNSLEFLQAATAKTREKHDDDFWRLFRVLDVGQAMVQKVMNLEKNVEKFNQTSGLFAALSKAAFSCIVTSSCMLYLNVQQSIDSCMAWLGRIAALPLDCETVETAGCKYLQNDRQHLDIHQS